MTPNSQPPKERFVIVWLTWILIHSCRFPFLFTSHHCHSWHWTMSCSFEHYCYPTYLLPNSAHTFLYASCRYILGIGILGPPRLSTSLLVADYNCWINKYTPLTSLAPTKESKPWQNSCLNSIHSPDLEQAHPSDINPPPMTEELEDEHPTTHNPSQWIHTYIFQSLSITDINTSN